ncbi:MAG: HEAT repeat domain-containing protein [Saprospiraceae bacterium]|nr:HEAT repeat domain-containing protein [Saprospiraceae bacterium]
MKRNFIVLLILIGAGSCNAPQPVESNADIISRHQTAEQVRDAERSIFSSSDIETAEGLEVALWASDSLAPDPIALSIDDYGRVYLTRTNRQKNSEFDIRGYEHWMTPSISFQSVEDRRAFLRETFAPEKSQENDWFPDLNGDGSHDWHDLTVEEDEVWRLEDSDGDGVADLSTRIVKDFHEEITDVAGALLVRREDMFIGIGPDMWRLTDTDHDGIPDKKESISHGYAIHIGFGAHGMSGVIEGPDGKIYWGIGDIGANVVDKEGQRHKYPNQGVIVRSNPDGSDFEVFAHGLRNTHEFVFDAYGNIISSDNDGDHPGESERLVHIVEGSDAGWRANWQYGKYTDPKNNSYKVWMDERMYIPHWEGQAAYIIPPIQNYHNGPTGLVFNPGTALGSNWLNTFFLVEFVGNPTRSPIWAFTLKPNGASFLLDEEQVALKGVLPTGLRFGPDGALYAADWVNGWGTKNYGRIWRLDVPDKMNDLRDLRERTREYMALDYGTQSLQELSSLLGYEDLRIRKKAQFELVKRGEEGARILIAALGPADNQFKRIHAIWGLGQLAAVDKKYADSILDLLSDKDREIVAQSAKVLGDVRIEAAAGQLVELLATPDPRVQFFAAQALGRIGYEDAQDALIAMLEANNDQDIYLRHSATLALARIGKTEKVIALKESQSKALRTAAVLVLRHLGDPALAQFLDDPDEYIVTEAARAIHDDWSVDPAMPALAQMLDNIKSESEPLVRRILSACQRLGNQEYLDLVLNYAQRKDVPRALKAEALAIIGTWAQPSVLDRVDGRYRGEVHRDEQMVINKVKPYIPSFLASDDSDVIGSAGRLLAYLDINDYNDRLAEIFRNHQDGGVRASLLTNLSQLDFPEMEGLIQSGMADKEEEVRSTALSMLDKMEISAERLPEIAKPVFDRGSIGEQQKLIGVLGSMSQDKTRPIFEDLIKRWSEDKIAPEIKLDILAAIDSSGSSDLKAMTSSLHSEETLMDQYAEALYGGDRREGWRIFNRHPTAQCTRCHSLTRDGEHESTTVGPPLHNIGNQLSREQLLQAVLEPSARISPGYGVVMLTLKDGQNVTGTLLEEKENELVIKANNPEPIRIQTSRIGERENLPSSMPPVGSFLSKMEVRDLVEFLANLKDPEM